MTSDQKSPIRKVYDRPSDRVYYGSGIQGVSNSKYSVDLEKLYKALDAKRRKDKLSWSRLAARFNIAETTIYKLPLKNGTNRGRRKHSISSDVLACIIMYLRLPLTDFIIENNVEAKNDNA
jgi:hypothetical protein